MTALRPSDPVVVWLADGKPIRFVWRGKHFTVTDAPTPIRETTGVAGPTHPTERLVGWRFQGTSAANSFVFDIHGDRHSGWRLVAVYS